MSANAGNVVIIGPSGKLGESVIHHLLNLDFTVTCLTRDASRASQSLPATITDKVTITQADYTSPETLPPSLLGHDVGIILTPRLAITPHILIVDALILAGVPHIIPSAFGIDLSSAYARSLPVFAGKLQILEHVARHATAGHCTYTALQTGIFFEWALESGLLLNRTPTGTTVLFDDGNAQVSVSTLDDIGKAVATAVAKRSNGDIPPNQTLFVQSAAVSQNQLLGYAAALVPSKRWDVMALDTEEAERVSWEAIRRGDTSREAMTGLIGRASFGMGIGLHKYLDNEVLGIEQADEKAIREIMAKII